MNSLAQTPIQKKGLEPIGIWLQNNKGITVFTSEDSVSKTFFQAQPVTIQVSQPMNTGGGYVCIFQPLNKPAVAFGLDSNICSEALLKRIKAAENGTRLAIMKRLGSSALLLILK
jgi:hypothetical protein